LISLNRPYKEFLNWVWLKERLKVDRGTVGIVDQQIRDYDDTIVKTKGNFWVLQKDKGKLGVQEYLNAFLKQTKYQIDGGVVLADIEENFRVEMCKVGGLISGARGSLLKMDSLKWLRMKWLKTRAPSC
jgi:hypothetical protein